jgi:hypothetical protein
MNLMECIYEKYQNKQNKWHVTTTFLKRIPYMSQETNFGINWHGSWNSFSLTCKIKIKPLKPIVPLSDPSNLAGLSLERRLMQV